MILTEHFRNPRNNKPLTEHDVALTNVNPLCGDMVNIQLKCADNIVTDVGIQANGCVISVAVSSLLSELILHKPLHEIEQLDAAVVQKLVGMELGPTRLKCALLGLNAIKEGIKKYKK
jgi:nitrogen fixation NifU-like protein